ncbi:cordon-bleu protein-like 1b isoform X2 [Oryzias melastigma]|uniref:cordon-bleu protein-like 1b isoform X2 n=1 Tax=Oryzias melastigma TaxID=30732 RepID=UPI000CF7E304|nr:cordon-bleu protein-like 1b isoform X2 [Oryzias melastigma]
MDDHGSQSHPRTSGLRVSRKSKAPSPPGLRLDSQGFSPWHPGNLHLTMEQKENLQDKELSLTVVLPGGVEQMTVVHGSKPLMDLLVTLCAKYHLNPASHTLELVTANKNSIKLKPSALIGTLDAEKVILKTKGEDKNKKTGPQMPEATVRMVINYKKTQKTILRVNPRVPLSELLPAICEKCEFDTETTVLMRDGQSLTPLDLSNSLNDYAIREVYARDTKGKAASPVCPNSPAGVVTPGKAKNLKEEENKGLFSMFRKSKKKSEQPTTVSAPGSPVLVSKPRPLSMALPCSNSSNFADVPKKRRAPQPPNRLFQRSNSDIGTTRRFSSEPGTQLDQVAGVSRGSSAESSLKRTKRKAPPPPTSAVVHSPVSQEELSQAIAAPKTLEEIMEKEEVTSASAAHNGVQGEDRSLSVSPEVSLQYLSPDIEMESTMSVEGGEEDRSDHSSDGIQSQVKDSTVATDAGKTNDSDVAPNSGCQIPVEDPSKPDICEGPPSDATDGQNNATSLPPAIPQVAETSVQTNTDAPLERADLLGSLEPQSASRPTGEDAQVQTDFEDFPAPPPQHADNRPASVNSSTSHTSETSPCRDSPPSASTATKGTSMFATDFEPKPKPSNEITRDYTPKVGMKTYTIVPQKSLEKLRYFEVALTLEAPPKAPAEGQNAASPLLDESTKQTGWTEVLENTTHPNIPSKDSLNNTSAQHTLNGDMSQPSSPASLHSTDEGSSAANGVSQAVSPAELKEMKIPPVTKPKPTSFRLPQLKKTPGYYVTSAAEKSPGAGPGFGLKETSGSSERAALPPPPLPPPVQCQQETAEAAGVQLSPKQVGGKVALSRQASLPLRESSTGLSLEKLRSFAAPKPYSPLKPSRFAQAVSSAVKRSQSLSHAPKSPPFITSTPTSPTPSLSSVTETRGLFCLKDCENRALEGDDSSLQREEGLQMAGECSP